MEDGDSSASVLYVANLPTKVIFDTNFLLVPIRFGIDIFSEAERVLETVIEFYVTDTILREIKILKGKSSKETLGRTIMTSPVICADADQPIDVCMALMTEKRIRHLPILDSDKLFGVVSLGDLVRTIISEQEPQIRGLESYILYQSDMPQ